MSNLEKFTAFADSYYRNKRRSDDALRAVEALPSQDRRRRGVAGAQDEHRRMRARRMQAARMMAPHQHRMYNKAVGFAGRARWRAGIKRLRGMLGSVNKSALEKFTAHARAYYRAERAHRKKYENLRHLEQSDPDKHGRLLYPSFVESNSAYNRMEPSVVFNLARKYHPIAGKEAWEAGVKRMRGRRGPVNKSALEKFTAHVGAYYRARRAQRKAERELSHLELTNPSMHGRLLYPSFEARNAAHNRMRPTVGFDLARKYQPKAGKDAWAAGVKRMRGMRGPVNKSAFGGAYQRLRRQRQATERKLTGMSPDGSGANVERARRDAQAKAEQTALRVNKSDLAKFTAHARAVRRAKKRARDAMREWKETPFSATDDIQRKMNRAARQQVDRTEQALFEAMQRMRPTIGKSGLDLEKRRIARGALRRKLRGGAQRRKKKRELHPSHLDWRAKHDTERQLGIRGKMRKSGIDLEKRGIARGALRRKLRRKKRELHPSHLDWRAKHDTERQLGIRGKMRKSGLDELAKRLSRSRLRRRLKSRRSNPELNDENAHFETAMGLGRRAARAKRAGNMKEFNRLVRMGRESKGLGRNTRGSTYMGG